jgi:glucoamylase
MKTTILILLLGLFSVTSFGQDRYTEMLRSSYTGVFTNLNNPEVASGVVIASPSRQNPNYFYHWVRDAGLTMMELVQLYQLPLKPERRTYLEQRISRWIEFEVRNQNTALSRSNLGEPIFTVTGDIYPHPWGRPQSDGPAIRALAMIDFAFALIDQGRSAEVFRLYRSEFPAQTPIKRDLEYVAHQWQEQAYDLWEEVRGNHFFTRMAQRAALIRGSQLAYKMNDPQAGAFYFQKALDIERALLAHKSDARGHIVPTLAQTDGWRHKTSEIDISVLLASIYFSLGDGFFDVEDPWVLATARKIEETFAQLYNINRDGVMSPAIGRYPEDVYTGNGFGEGNPWFLATNAFGEYYCRLSKRTANAAESTNYLKKAVSFLDRTIYHSDPGGHMPEQFNRNNGFTQGAKDLTWSYTSYIRAYRSCANDVTLLDHKELDTAQEISH